MQPVSHAHHLPPPPTGATNSPGKSAQSVGHQAKQAVATAREAGIELPKNAQGFAASQIASGADPATLFAAQVEDPPVDSADVSTEAADEPVEVPADTEQPAETAAPPPQESVDSAPPTELAPQFVTDAEAALELLTGDADQAT